LTLLWLCLSVTPAFAQKIIRVAASSQDLAAIAQAVGGDKVSVFSLSSGMQNPHFVPPKPSAMVKLKNADMVVRTGMELDIWMDPLIEGSRNTALFRNAAGYVDASVGVHVLGAPASKIDRSMGDVHPYGNPHYWLDPVNAKTISLNIVNGLKRVDPADAAYFDAQRQAFLKQLAAHLTQWIQQAKPLAGTPVITYHDSWPYFAGRFGLNVVGTVEPLPGMPPSPKSLAQLIAKAKSQQVKFILVEPYFNRASCDAVAQASGARVIVMPPSVGGAPGVNDYFQLFDRDLGLLLQALH